MQRLQGLQKLGGLLAVLVGYLCLLSCSQESTTVIPDSTATTAAAGAGSLPDEQWDLNFMQGMNVGYQRTTVKPVTEDGRELVAIEQYVRLAIQRFGENTTPESRMTSIETPQGELVRFDSEMTFGPQPTKFTGRVEGSELVIESQTAGKREINTIAWPADAKGFCGVEQSLVVAPMKPGERRMLKVLWPMLNQVVEVDLAARDWEETPVLQGSQKLFRIESLARLPGGAKLDSVIWTDEHGHQVKSHSDAMQMDSYRTTKEIALAEPTTPRLDMGAGAIVPVARPLPNAHQTKRARYRIELAGGDPQEVFARSATQQLKPLDAHSAEISVTRFDANSPPPAAAGDREPTDDDRKSNSLVQSDDPLVVEMAQTAKGNLQDPHEIALALEKYVHSAIQSKNFSQAFATAAEVAQSKEGDCTEHAVLLAALARACGIPARVAIGLVYVEGAQGFGYHMWDEVYVSGRWVPLDATLAGGGIGAAHLKLTDSNLKGASSYSSFLPVAQVLGRLKISVLEAE